MMSMMDSTSAVVALMVLIVVLLVGVLVFTRVLAAREASRTTDHVPHPHRSRATEVSTAAETEATAAEPTDP